MSARAATYLDANAGLPPLTPIREKVGEILPLLHNSSSIHAPGRQSRALILRARKKISTSLAELLKGLTEEDWIATSGATESLQGAIRACMGTGEQSAVWFASPTEHAASLKLKEEWESKGQHSFHWLPTDAFGRVDVDAVDGALDRAGLTSGSRLLVTLIWANNETGVIQHDLERLCQILKKRGAWIILDGAQAWQKSAAFSEKSLPLSMIDFFGASGHKLGAFAGTGVLAFSREGRRLLHDSPILRGTQQSGLRSGTENTLGIWSLGEAAEAHPWKNLGAIQQVRDELQTLITRRISDALVNGGGAARTANTLNLTFEGAGRSSLKLVDRLDLEGFAVSAGSACSSGNLKPSHVLQAMGLSDDRALGSIRISLPPEAERIEDLLPFVAALERVVGSARREARS